ncbi:PA14 domain-containing protein, partial [Aquibacillus koreensis]|uniref:PA14 domain-containing protein n=1 Tax=Aquibacillus koreensis TaxID=279446 RepID=UPI002340457E
MKAQGDGSLIEDHGNNAPISNVPKDKYSAKYVTAKKITAGDYIIRSRADDGIRVYIDDKLVLNRWSTSNYQEDAVEVSIKDRVDAKPGQADVHWIRVEYFESTGKSKIDVSIKQKNEEITTDSWLGAYYNNKNLSGRSTAVVGGAGSVNPINALNYDWGYTEPHAKISHYNYSSSFFKKVVGGKDYFVQTYADDGIRV